MLLVLTPKKIYAVTAVEGEIIIGDFKETFVMPIEYWSIKDYQRQWQEGLERIKTHKQSCLIASIYNPKKRPFVNWWVLYKEKNIIFIQNHFIFDEIYQDRVDDKPFTRETCYDYIPPRRTIDEEGNKLSEWNVNLS